MDFKAHAKQALGTSRGLIEGVLEAFKTPADWLYQSHPKANHATWIIGHLGLADNAFIGNFREDLKQKPDGWDDFFWFGSELRADTSVYPGSEELLGYFRERRETLLKVLDECTDEQLNAPAPTEGSPIAGAPNIGHYFLFAAVHEGVHFGQLSVAHRGLGNGPMITPG